MPATLDWYDDNPMVKADRRRAEAPTAWQRSFAVTDVRPLIVCRGPIRKEAMDVFEQMGITGYGILLSEKDSIVYTQALAPELRRTRPEQVHRVKDYSGASREERRERTQQLIGIAREHGYTHVFAGYGFMAEDEEFVRTLEEAGVGFLGPRSSVHGAAGRKDEAKRTALAEAVSVTPGIDDATARTLLRQHPDLPALRRLAAARGFDLGAALADGAALREAAEAVLEASYRAGVDLFTVEELCEEIRLATIELFTAHPGRRIRLKAIGGGGGKGQRILVGAPAGSDAAAIAEAAAVAPSAAREVLGEVKAGGVGDNKNMLLELNVEETRHNEIQLVGNGAWCVAMGGRDCSLQMHEQKLLEVSVTDEELAWAAEQADRAGRPVEAAALRADRETLRRMEAEAERFGVAVGLNSASTFECIVEGDHHYFMEVNTRIQVEHRVSELCYALRFTNPEDPADSFLVTSLVECMVLLGRHGARLPRPTRERRELAAVEARLNATDRSLAPHAGGLVMSWSDPIDHEIRDDQGICSKNPDTGLFVHYRLAGAYDSNIALLVTYGGGRVESYTRLAEILRRAKLRGSDLCTNLEFHYGLVHWFLARNPYAKPTTRFVVPYLTAVGLLLEEAQRIDLTLLWSELTQRRTRPAGKDPAAVAAAGAWKKVLTLKETLLRRPLEALLREPHLFSAWLSVCSKAVRVEGERVVWLENPIDVLRATYQLLHMDRRNGTPAALVIWDHDEELLDTAGAFYAALAERLGPLPFPALEQRLANPTPPAGFDEQAWTRVRQAHLGHQAGLEILGVLPLIGARAGFDELRVEADLTITIPPRLLDRELQVRARKLLAPPPVTRADEVVAVSGGMFYAQEAPGLPHLAEVGTHFKAGDPLYVIEVMKMFNKVLATFSGTVEAVLVEGNGTIVQKGQPLFRVRPDERPVDEDPKERAERLARHTRGYLAALDPG